MLYLHFRELWRGKKHTKNKKAHTCIAVNACTFTLDILTRGLLWANRHILTNVKPKSERIAENKSFAADALLASWPLQADLLWAMREMWRAKFDRKVLFLFLEKGAGGIRVDGFNSVIELNWHEKPDAPLYGWQGWKVWQGNDFANYKNKLCFVCQKKSVSIHVGMTLSILHIYWYVEYSTLIPTEFHKKTAKNSKSSQPLLLYIFSFS